MTAERRPAAGRTAIPSGAVYHLLSNPVYRGAIRHGKLLYGFAVTTEGQVLIFEANATMLTHLEPEDGPFAAKNRFIRPIIEAFQARLAMLANA